FKVWVRCDDDLLPTNALTVTLVEEFQARRCRSPSRQEVERDAEREKAASPGRRLMFDIRILQRCGRSVDQQSEPRLQSGHQLFNQGLNFVLGLLGFRADPPVREKLER